jgi:hypothetical protein
MKAKQTIKSRKAKKIKKSALSSTGQGICKFMANLFEANELAPANKKKTDDELSAIIQAEYPTHLSAVNLQSGKLTINSHRVKYNSGGFTNGAIPERMSFRYNSKGQVVNGRTGRVPLLKEDVEDMAKAHAKKAATVNKNIAAIKKAKEEKKSAKKTTVPKKAVKKTAPKKAAKKTSKKVAKKVAKKAAKK